MPASGLRQCSTHLRRSAASGAVVAIMALAATLASAGHAQEKPGTGTVVAEDMATLEKSFENPPSSARPLVWWHWMNGNITEDGIRKDLEWMKRSGIAGVQNFQIDITTPQIVDKPLAFMTPGWKEAFRFAASEADRLGLEMAIAASPGFSETGGPWVPPQDAMKKIAWSETIIEGGRRFTGKLAKPPETTGTFQDMPLRPLLAPLTGEKSLPTMYRDSLVFAYRAPSQPEAAVNVSLAGQPLNAALLADGSFDAGIAIPKGSVEKPSIVELTFDKPQSVRAVTVSTRGGFQIFQPGITLSRLESSVDGTSWSKVVDIGPNFSPTTISFKPVEARYFRLVVMKVGGTGVADPDAAPGVDTSPFDIFKTTPDVELTELRLSTESRIDRWEAKAGFASLPDRYAPDAGLDVNDAGVNAGEVIDLTGRMRADGTLDWTPPRGRWRVVRMGWSLLGTTNHPAPADSTGFEVDKLDSAAVRRYLETYLGKYREAAGADLIGKRGVRALLTDSTEVGAFNWTPGLLGHFKRLRGYDPRPWLPALTGAIVETRALSDGFLYDFRRTLSDLHSTEHYATVAAVAHENGLKLYGEALEGSGGSPGDDLDMRRYADVPMAAQWTGKPQPVHEADMRGAASVAHFYGKNIVAAESLTSSSQPWAFAPKDLRRTVDLIFASGVNRPVIHTSIHVPRDDKLPGLSLWIYGQYFNRADTWAEMARPWVDYIARSSLLLQAGRPVADVAHFYGEERPIANMSFGGLPADLPKRYAYDFVSAKAILEDARVEQGNIVGPGGNRYRVLHLGGSSERMTLPVLRRIAELVEQGATVVGDAPKRSPGLDDGGCEYAALVGRLWPGGEMATVGKGRVIAGRDVEAALGRIGVAPDFSVTAPPAETDIRFVHRSLPDGDIYFVANQGKQGGTFDARFRVKGRAPDIWDASAATIGPASYRIDGGATTVPLELAGGESLFVVFRRDEVASSRIVRPATTTELGEIRGPWKLTFQQGRGAPASTTFAALKSLSESTDPGIKYFSGVTTYSTAFEVPRSHRPGAPLLVDLGQLGDVAEIFVNGERAGIAWLPPYRVDIGKLARGGRNRLEIRVANLWVNRLIGDRQPGAAPITYTSTPTYKADAPLRPSGLIGPVRLLELRR